MFGKKKKQEKEKTKLHLSDMHCRIITDFPKEDEIDAIQSWRVFRITAEFVQGFQFLRKYQTAATFFGSARCCIGDSVYDAAEELASMLAKSGFSVITGGGGGVMEAANRGAFKAKGDSVGLNIKLPMEQQKNDYLTDVLEFEFFFSRKMMLSFASEVYIYFPGGFGTMDEFFEMVTLIQTKKISRVPIILYGKAYWSPLIDFIENTMRDTYHTISPEDRDLFEVVDSVEEAYRVITKKVDPCTPIQM